MKKFLFFLILLFCASVEAADIVWTNTLGGTWGTAANWSPNQVPTSADTAWITNNGTYTVTQNVASATALSLALGGTSGTQTLNHNGGTLALGAGGSSSANGAYALSGGTLTGSGTLTLGGPLNWTSGVLGSTASNLAVVVNGGLNISGSATKSLNGGILVNGGAGSWAGPGQVNCSAPAVFSNSPSATFDLLADGNALILNAGSSVPVANAGLFRKTGGTGLSTVNIVFNNSGTVDIQSGTLALSGGGTNSGQFISSASGATLRFSGGTHSLQDTSTISGPGGLSVLGGTLNVLGTVSIGGLTNAGGTLNFNGLPPSYVTNLTVSSGTLTASNIVTVPGTFGWTGGTIGIAGSPGLIALNGGAGFSGSTKTFNGGTILNNSTAAWLAGQISCNGNALFTNTPSALLDLQADGAAFANNGGSALLANAGTLRKSAGTGATTIATACNNSGLVQVQSGLLALSGGGTNSGQFTMASGTTLNFSGGNHLLQSSSLVSGPGNLSVSVGTVNAQCPVMVNWLTNNAVLNFSQTGTVYPTNVALTGGGLIGSNTVIVPGIFSWSGGAFGNAASTLALIASGTMTMNGGNKSFLNGTLVNAGSGVWTAGQVNFIGGVFSNAPAATFDLQGDASAFTINSGSPFMVNAGTYRKTAGTGITTCTLPCANFGSVQVNTGTLTLTLIDGTGSFAPAAGASLIVNGTATLSAAGSISGPGNFEVNFGSLTNHGSYNIGGTNTFSGGTARMDGTSIMNNSPLVISGGNLIVSGSGNLAPSSLNFSGGSLQGSLAMTVSGPTIWSRGTFGGAGSTLSLFANGGLTLNGSTKTISGGTFVNGGAGAWLGGQLNCDGGVFSNAPSATLDLQADGTSFVFSSGSPLFVNAGTFRKTAGTGTNVVTLVCANSGAVEVDSGTLILTVTDGSGSFTPAAGTKLILNGNATFSPAASISGPGNFEMTFGSITNHGTLNITGTSTFSGGIVRMDGTCLINNTPLVVSGGIISFNGSGNLAPSVLTLSAGTLQGSMPMTVSGPFLWSGGAFGSAGSTMILSANGGLTFSNNTPAKTLGGGTLVNNGPATWTNGQVICGTAIFSNSPSGTLDLLGDGTVFLLNTGTPLLFNAGTVRKTFGTGTTLFTVPLANSGLMQVNSGNLSITVTDSTGNFAPSAGASLQFNGTATLSGTASISGPGNFEMTSGSITNHGTMNISGTNIFSGGTIKLDGTCTINNAPLVVSGGNVSFSGSGNLAPASLNLSAGVLQGSMPMAVSGLFSWTGGTIGASGSTLSLTANGSLTIGGAFSKFMSGGTLINNGTATWQGPSVGFTAGVFSNSASGTLDLLADGNGFVPSGGAPLIANDGTIRKTAGSGSTLLTVACNNSGVIQANTGTLSMGAYIQNGGQTILNGGNFAFAQTAQLRGGSLSGSGKVTGSISNNATVSPGASPGLLTITGSYTEGPGAHLQIELGGTSAGVTYDQLAIGGSAKLAGALDISYWNGFEPALGNVFTGLVANARSGGFSVVHAPTNTLGTIYTSKSVLLEVGNASPTAQLLVNQVQAACHTFILRASAVDPDGTVTNLSVLQDTNLLVSTSGSSAQITYSSDFPGDLNFTVLATDEKGASGATNIIVTIAPLPPLAVYPVGFQTNRAFKLCMTGEEGTNYEVQASSDLGGANWSVLGVMQNTNGIWRYSDLTATNAAFRFYRTRQLP